MIKYSRVIAGERWVPEIGDESFINTCYQYATSYAAGKTVLDAGCGVGCGANVLSKHAKLVIGIDYSATALEYGQTHYCESNIYFTVMDCRYLGFGDQTFDAVVSSEVFEHIAEYNLFLAEIYRILKPDGIFILSTPNKFFDMLDNIGLKLQTPYHVNVMYLNRLCTILRRRFHLVHIYGIRTVKKPLFIHILRVFDLFNLRLLLSRNQRTTFGALLGGGHQTTNKFEVKPLRCGHVHTFSHFLAICKKR